MPDPLDCGPVHAGTYPLGHIPDEYRTLEPQPWGRHPESPGRPNQQAGQPSPSKGPIVPEENGPEDCWYQAIFVKHDEAGVKMVVSGLRPKGTSLRCHVHTRYLIHSLLFVKKLPSGSKIGNENPRFYLGTFRAVFLFQIVNHSVQVAKRGNRSTSVRLRKTCPENGDECNLTNYSMSSSLRNTSLVLWSDLSTA